MSKKLSFEVDAKTGEAKRNLEDLGKQTRKIQDEFGENSDLTRYFNNLTNELEDFNKNLKSIIESINKSGSISTPSSTSNNNTSSSTASNIPSTPQVPSNGGKSPSLNEKETANTIGNLAAKIFTGGAAIRYFRQSIESSKNAQWQSMLAYNKTGMYGSDFRSGRWNAYNTGLKYGADTQETMGLQTDLMAQTGFKNQDALNSDTTSALALNRAYGIDMNSLTSGYGDLVKTGFEDNLKGYSELLVGSIKAGGMTGREDEQVQAINELARTLTKNTLKVSSDDFKGMVSLQTELARQNPALKGERGANLISQVADSFSSSNEQILRLAGFGTQFHGVEGLVKAKELIEKKDANTFKTIFANMDKYGINSEAERVLFLNQYGTSIEKSKAMVGAVKNGEDIGDAFQQTGLTDIEDKNKTALKSDAMAMRQGDLARQNAQTVVGDDLTRGTSWYDRWFTGLPSQLSSTASMATAIGMPMFLGRGLSKGLGGLGGLSGGFSGFGGALKGIKPGMSLSGFGGLFDNGLGIGNALPELTGGASAASTIAGAGSKFVSVANKAMPWIPAAIGGAKGIYDFSKGEKRKGVSEIAGGLGGSGGALIGAAIGTAAIPIPGVGTLVGGTIGSIAGSFAGSKLGKFGYDKFTETKEEKERRKKDELTEKVDASVNKFDKSVDKLLGITTSYANEKGSDPSLLEAQKEKSIFDDSKNPLLGEDYQQAKNDYISTGQMGVPTVGNDFLGKISSKYEVGEKGNGGFISTGAGDFGGKSYGLPQFTSKGGGASANSFVSSLKGTAFEQFFTGAGKAGTKSFDDAWKKAYQSDPRGFTKLQQGYAYRNNVEPYINKVKKQHGIDFNRSRALQELAFSTAIQLGPSGGMTVLGGINSMMTDEQIIKQVYANKRNNVEKNFKSSPALWNSLRNNRFKTEEKDLLELLNQPAVKAYGTGKDRIEKDQLAFLHKDETVLNKFQAKEYREGISGNSSINLNINISGQENAQPELMEAIRKAIDQAIRAATSDTGVDLSRSYGRVPV